MTVPLVAAFSACTSTYGRVAPTPPVAAAKAGPADRIKVLPATRTVLATSAPARARGHMARIEGSIRRSLSTGPRWASTVTTGTERRTRRIGLCNKTVACSTLHCNIWTHQCRIQQRTGSIGRADPAAVGVQVDVAAADDGGHVPAREAGGVFAHGGDTARHRGLGDQPRRRPEGPPARDRPP